MWNYGNVIDYEYYNLNKSVDFILKVTEAICEQIPGPGAKECIYISDVCKILLVI